MKLRLEITLCFSFRGRKGSIRCLLENAEMIERHLRQDGCSRVWIPS
jgi:hypothetical protein